MFCSLLMTVHATAQDHKHVLFLGNSYTFSNNLPVMLSELALSAGDTVTHASNTPGGYTLAGHSTNSNSLELIEEGFWDYVVLQEQSQAPSFPQEQVEAEVFPYAALLNELILESNPCAETVFFMTWGRENGDASNCAVWPPVCTYEGMDDLLRERYIQMAIDNDGMVCAAGAVWRHIRETDPTIDLYQTDGSHPSAIGTYAIACSFYSSLFQKSASLITDDQSLSADDAAFIRAAVDEVIFNDLEAWFIGGNALNAAFNYTMDSGAVVFETEPGAGAYTWNFGDGTTSNETNPNHTYNTAGTYEVTLTIAHCGQTASTTQTITVETIGAQEIMDRNNIKIYPNPAQEFVTITGCPNLPIAISNAYGEVVLRLQSQQDQFSLGLENLASGVYYVRIGRDGDVHYKLVVQ